MHIYAYVCNNNNNNNIYLKCVAYVKSQYVIILCIYKLPTDGELFDFRVLLKIKSLKLEYLLQTLQYYFA